MHDESEDLRRVGRDEMNLCRVPHRPLTDYPPEGVKTLVFEDRHGTLTVVGSDDLWAADRPRLRRHRRPDPLTKTRNDFTDPTVAFTRYELLKLLGWPDQTRYYQRLTESLHRWVGVTLRYDGCWWDNRRKRRVDASFHILDDVILFEDEDELGRALVLHLGQEVLQELPGRQPQAARPRHLLRAEERHQQAALSLPRQAVLPPARLDLRPPRAGLRARRHEPELRAVEDQSRSCNRPSRSWRRSASWSR